MQVHAAQHGKTSPFQSYSKWWWLQTGDHRGPALLSLCFNPLRLVLLEFIQWIWLNLIMYDCVVERWRYHGRCIQCAKFWIQSSIAARPPVNRIRRGVCRMCQQALQLAQINAAPICHGMTVCRSIPFVSWTDWRIFKIPCGAPSKKNVEMKVGSILCACVPAFTAVFDAPGGAIHECPLWTCRESGRFFQYGVTSSALGIAGRNAKSEPTYCAYSILIQYLEYL